MIRIIQRHRTLAARVFPSVVQAVVIGALLVPARPTHAAGTAEQACQKGRYSAAAQYSACQQKALAKFFAGGGDYQAASGKCRTKYAAVWPKLRAKAPGSTCDTTRFTDNGTTVTDNLTALQWEKTTDDATVHDKDNVYSWSAGLVFSTVADGTAFTAFLPALNGGGCFAGQCDWRLPTICELQTIIPEAAPCTTIPCIDPVFGPTNATFYWSATTVATSPGLAWFVDLDNGGVSAVNKNGTGYAVRAVRAGW